MLASHKASACGEIAFTFLLFEVFSFSWTEQNKYIFVIFFCNAQLISMYFVLKDSNYWVAKFREYTFVQSHLGFYMWKTTPQMSTQNTDFNQCIQNLYFTDQKSKLLKAMEPTDTRSWRQILHIFQCNKTQM